MKTEKLKEMEERLLKLPENNEDRYRWLIAFGTSSEAIRLRLCRRLAIKPYKETLNTQTWNKAS